MKQVKENIMSFGASKVGFADLSITPSEQRNGRMYGISIGLKLNKRIVSGVSNGPTVEYNEEYHRVNAQLNEIGLKTALYINSLGYAAEAQITTEVSVRKDNITDILPHKTVATLGGMGWIGKNALLITPEFGSAVRLSAIYTDMPLDVAKPVTKSNCGGCRICVEACPASAMTGHNWVREKEREYIYDSHKCRTMAVELCRRAGIDNTICGICINVCPYTQRYLSGKEASF